MTPLNKLSEIFSHILAEQGQLPVELRDIWIRMIGFRHLFSKWI